jgi:hypothetical protein
VKPPWWARWSTDEFTLGTCYFLTKWGADRYYWRRFRQIGGLTLGGIQEPVRLSPEDSA